jgi:hypothetical protein
VQSLLPFDVDGAIVRSLQKTSKVLFLDEDVPGGATAYMMQEVVERQGGFHWLDAAPRTLSAAAHRAPYGRDGDYWSKPNVETVFDAVYEIVSETAPARLNRDHGPHTETEENSSASVPDRGSGAGESPRPRVLPGRPFLDLRTRRKKSGSRACGIRISGPGGTRTHDQAIMSRVL